MCTTVSLQKIVNIDDYDPGSCNKTNAFQVYSVKDRNDKTRLWICSKEKGKYLWKSVNGWCLYININGGSRTKQTIFTALLHYKFSTQQKMKKLYFGSD